MKVALEIAKQGWSMDKPPAEPPLRPEEWDDEEDGVWEDLLYYTGTDLINLYCVSNYLIKGYQ